jgi:hypothetical protein
LYWLVQAVLKWLDAVAGPKPLEGKNQLTARREVARLPRIARRWRMSSQEIVQGSAMQKASHLAAILLFSVSATAHAGPAPGADLTRVFSPPSSKYSARIPSFTVSSLTLPSQRAAAAMTTEHRIMPLDQLRLPSSLQVSSARVPETNVSTEESSPVAFAIHWSPHPTLVNPEVVRRAANMRRTGLPIVHLWQSNNNLVALGLSPRGIPGVYFTQRISN